MNTIVSDSPESPARVRAAVRAQQQRPGFAMDRFFYQSAEVYSLELDRLVFRSWLYAGHASQIPESGDFFQYEVGNDAFIVSRTADGAIHAFVNSCRHRGARVCEDMHGNTRNFACPYHGWVYNGDGTLRSARHMDSLQGFRRDEHGLRQLRVVVRHGLVFVNADPAAFDLGTSIDLVEPALAPYRFAEARIAHREIYPVEANWKLVLENFIECYHCASSHREYAHLHSLKEPRSRTTALRDAMLARSEQRTGVAGLDLAVERIYGNAPGFGACTYSWRHALYDDKLSGSRDGRPLAPLLGEFRGYDGGASDFAFGPLCFMLNYPDHGVLYRFTPRGVAQTDMELCWFVRADAVEGRDYTKDDLTWLWHTTTLQDEHIIRRNAAGVNSEFYSPGPLHPEFEQYNLKFIAWYLAVLAGDPARDELAERRGARG